MIIRNLLLAGFIVLVMAKGFAQVGGGIERPGDGRHGGGHHDRDRGPDRDHRGEYSREIIYCESVDHRLNYCRVRGEISRVSLVRQHSSAPCSLGRTFGYDNQSIWVDRGCRAEFEVITVSSNYPPPRPGPGPSEQIIQCESINGGYGECFVGGYGDIIDVQMVRQYSQHDCRPGYSYGFNYERVWVDRGCRASFRVLKGYRR